MLTADLVQTYRRGDRLNIRRLDKRARAAALDFATVYLNIARQHIGAPKSEFDAACKAVPVHVRDKKLAAGLLKMVQDRCNFEMNAEVDAVTLRRAVFRAASEHRQAAVRTETFCREEILERIGDSFNISGEDADKALFSDLKSAHILTELEDTTAEHLLTQYQRAQEQAVLLRATRVNVRIKPAGAPLLRRLFHRLKFLRLIHVIRPLRTGGYEIEIDGPFSLFTAVTKYGLQLALILPALDEAGKWQLDAGVLWGKERKKLTFHIESQALDDFEQLEDESFLSDDIQSLIKRFQTVKTEWDVSPSTEILEVRGLGLTIPDLVFTHRQTGEVIYFEVMGFWSRNAVWRRIELVEAGLEIPVIFAVSKRLRVSESVLNADLPSTLYVYKGVMNATKIAEILDRKFSEMKA